jgi:ribose/xylose/arabinose/galactoside ABC-type transport system permease subunit
MSEKEIISNKKVFLPVFALAVALRVMFDIHSRNWIFTNEFLDFLNRLLPCVLIATGVTFFWNLFRRKK